MFTVTACEEFTTMTNSRKSCSAIKLLCPCDIAGTLLAHRPGDGAALAAGPMEQIGACHFPAPKCMDSRGPFGRSARPGLRVGKCVTSIRWRGRPVSRALAAFTLAQRVVSPASEIFRSLLAEEAGSVQRLDCRSASTRVSFSTLAIRRTVEMSGSAAS